MPRPTRNSRLRATDLELTIDGYTVTALVDTGADYSVISGPFAAELKEVATAWDSPKIRTAGGHLIRPVGRCTSRVTVNRRTYPVSFVILHQCSRDIISGMDFLSEHRAIIDVRSMLITLSTDQAVASKTAQEHPVALKILDEKSPCRADQASSSPFARNIQITKAIVEGNTQLLMDAGLGTARGITRFQNGQAQVLVTNFSKGYQHIRKGTTIALLDELADIGNVVVAISDQPADGRSQHDQMLTFDIKACPKRDKT